MLPDMYFIKRNGAYILSYYQASNYKYLYLTNIKTEPTNTQVTITSQENYKNSDKLQDQNVYINASTGEVNVLYGNEVLYFLNGVEQRYNTYYTINGPRHFRKMIYINNSKTTKQLFHQTTSTRNWIILKETVIISSTSICRSTIIKSMGW